MKPLQKRMARLVIRLKRQLAEGKKYRKTPVYLAILLGAFSLVGAVLLSTGYEVTSEPIAQRLKEDLMSSLAMVIPLDKHDNDLVRDSYGFTPTNGDKRIIYPATNKGIVTALAYQVIGQGYGGTIKILMGVDKSGAVLGVRVLQHAETPGLGDLIEEGKGKWILGFNGLSLGNPPPENWAVKKDGGQFDQFSGATITPRAVVRAVRAGLEFFAANKRQLLSRQQETGS